MNTPRTNAEVWIHDYMGKKFSVVGADFARQLETEVQELRAALEKFANLDTSTCSDLWAIRKEYCDQARAALAKVPK